MCRTAAACSYDSISRRSLNTFKRSHRLCPRGSRLIPNGINFSCSSLLDCIKLLMRQHLQSVPSRRLGPCHNRSPHSDKNEKEHSKSSDVRIFRHVRNQSSCFQRNFHFKLFASSISSLECDNALHSETASFVGTKAGLEEGTIHDSSTNLTLVAALDDPGIVVWSPFDNGRQAQAFLMKRQALNISYRQSLRRDTYKDFIFLAHDGIIFTRSHVVAMANSHGFIPQYFRIVGRSKAVSKNTRVLTTHSAIDNQRSE